LYQPRIIGLGADDSVLRIPKRQAGVTELRMVQEIEKLRSELERNSLLDGRILEQRDIPIIDAIGSQLRIGPRR
jgi:hypothetical protein